MSLREAEIWASLEIYRRHHGPTIHDTSLWELLFLPLLLYALEALGIFSLTTRCAKSNGRFHFSSRSSLSRDCRLRRQQSARPHRRTPPLSNHNLVNADAAT